MEESKQIRKTRGGRFKGLVESLCSNKLVLKKRRKKAKPGKMSHSLLGEVILIFFFGKYCDSENLKCKQQDSGGGEGGDCTWII